MLTPTSIPVTAGKKTANTTQNGTEFSGEAPHNSISVDSMGLPKIREIREIPIAIRIKYCTLLAALADTRATPATKRIADTAISFSFNTGNTSTILSAKPTVYIETDRAWAR